MKIFFFIPVLSILNNGINPLFPKIRQLAIELKHYFESEQIYVAAIAANSQNKNTLSLSAQGSPHD